MVPPYYCGVAEQRWDDMDTLTDEIESILFMAREVMGE